MPWNSGARAPDELEYSGSSAMPARAAAAAHWCLRCSVGATTVIVSTVRSARSSVATRRPKVVLPAPGVATARASLGRAMRYLRRAVRCHASIEDTREWARVACAVCPAGPRTATGSLTRLQCLVDARALWAHWRTGLGGRGHREDLAAAGDHIRTHDRALGDLLLVHVVEEP